MVHGESDASTGDSHWKPRWRLVVSTPVINVCSLLSIITWINFNGFQSPDIQQSIALSMSKSGGARRDQKETQLFIGDTFQDARRLHERAVAMGQMCL